MKKIPLFAALALVVVLAGCSSMSFLPGKFGAIPMTSSPLASALRQCAMFTELLTPGVNLAAVAELARSAMADNALGNSPQGAMRNCAGLLDTVAN